MQGSTPQPVSPNRHNSVDSQRPAASRPVRIVVCAGMMLIAALFSDCDIAPVASAMDATSAPPAYVGGQVCSACHEREAELWKGSHHALAMQPANNTTVLGDFDHATFEKDGVLSTFFRRDGEYFVHTDGPDGQLHDYKIAYTFGVDPLQQYLIVFPNGRYQALSIAWDSRPAAAGGQRWFHLYPHEKIDHRDILHWTGPLQNWNFMCADCHSTNLQKNYRLAEDRYDTTWSDFSVSCEACHGPGSRHVEWARDAPHSRPSPDPTRGLVAPLKDASGGIWTFPPGEAIARRTEPLSSRVELETCGRCHARRAQVGGDDQTGHQLAESYRVALLDAGLYHADGQIHDEVYEYGSFLQSKMQRAGVTCSNCHEPHSGRLRTQGNALCAQCHLPATYNGPQHHFHQSDTAGAQCISCHMIERFYMVIDGRRDHSFRVPRPDLSMKIDTPNACTDCHTGRTAQWAADALAQWYGPNRRGGWHYGEAIDAGQHARANAEPLLAQTVEDTTLPNIVRATALSLLPQYLGPQSVRALESSVRDHDPLVRRAAAAALSVVEPRARVSLGMPLLGDPIRTVRLEAVTALVDVPRNLYTPDQLATLQQVIAEYRQAQAFNADRAEAHVNLGSLDARLGNMQAAESAYRTALRLQASFIPAYINLADLYRQQGREDSVIQTLREALRVDPGNGAAHHALGLSLVRQQRLRDAIPELAQAAQLRPDLPRYAYVYGVALHETGQVPRALQVLTEAQARHPGDRDILVALVEYSRQAGDRQGAIAWARKLVEMSPGDLRARRLLESLERQP
jgi:predicted CXXCH cytochrome family protein